MFKGSKYRFIYTENGSDPCNYWDLELPVSNVDQVIVKCNSKFFGVPIRASTGQLLVKPVKGSERITFKTPKIMAHRCPINAFSFDPFHEFSLVTGSDDGEIKVWKLPSSGLTSNETESSITLEGHHRKILSLEYNPSTNHLLASCSGDFSCRLWDVEHPSSEVLNIALPSVILQEAKWDGSGSLLCTAMKNKEFYLWDTRTGGCVNQWVGHDSPRQTHLTFLGNSLSLVTTGYNKSCKREVVLRDLRAIDQAIHTITVDNSPGPLIPFYNTSSHLLWFSGRGDGTIKGVDVLDSDMWNDSNSLLTVPLKNSSKSVAMMPQSLLNISNNEIDRFIRISMENTIESISVLVPRQAGTIASDLYGQIASGEPAQSAADWVKGQILPMRMKNAVGSAKGVSSRAHEVNDGIVSDANVKEWIWNYRSKCFSDSEIKILSDALVTEYNELCSTSSCRGGVNDMTMGRDRRASLTLRRQSRIGGNSRVSVARSSLEKKDITRSNGVTRRSSIFALKSPESSPVVSGAQVSSSVQASSKVRPPNSQPAPSSPNVRVYGAPSSPAPSSPPKSAVGSPPSSPPVSPSVPSRPISSVSTSSLFASSSSTRSSVPKAPSSPPMSSSFTGSGGLSVLATTASSPHMPGSNTPIKNRPAGLSSVVGPSSDRYSEQISALEKKVNELESVAANVTRIHTLVKGMESKMQALDELTMHVSDMKAMLFNLNQKVDRLSR